MDDDWGEDDWGDEEEDEVKEVDKKLNLNKLSDNELAKHKRAMDKDFNANQLKPGDAGFTYDKVVDFGKGGRDSPMGEDSWGEESEADAEQEDEELGSDAEEDEAAAYEEESEDEVSTASPTDDEGECEDSSEDESEWQDPDDCVGRLTSSNDYEPAAVEMEPPTDEIQIEIAPQPQHHMQQAAPALATSPHRTPVPGRSAANTTEFSATTAAAGHAAALAAGQNRSWKSLRQLSRRSLMLQ